MPAEPSVKDENDRVHASPKLGARDARGVWPVVSLITNAVFLTAAVTAGMMHVLSADHGGRTLRLRTMDFASTGVAYAVATCTAALYGLLLATSGRLMIRW
eukprot:2121230-Pleurochrysis_carterae.AAC.1